MSVESFAEREREHLAARLTGIYARWMLAYLVGVALLWYLGIEAIFQHPTPFYDVLVPGFRTTLVPGAAISLMMLAYVVYAAQAPHRPKRSWVRPLILWAVFTVLLIAVGFMGRNALAPLGTLTELLWRPLVRHLLVLGLFLAGLAALAIAMRRLRWFEEEQSPRATRWMLAALVFFAAAFPALVASIRPDGIIDAYSRFSHEYIGDIGFGGSLRGLFADYLNKHDYLSMHAKVHPPGPVALLWILSYVAGRQPLGLSLATIVFGSLAILPLYGWVNDRLGKRTALTACIVYTLVPSIVLFTATSADILFMPFTLLTLFLFGRALDRASLLYAVGAGLTYAVASLLSFSLLSLGAYFGFMGLWYLMKPKRRYAVMQTAVVMLAAFLALHLAVRIWANFDVVAVFHAAKAQFDTDQANIDKLAPRFPSWTWKFLNPLAWFFFAGIPVSILFVWRLARPAQDSKAFFLVILFTFLALDLLYLARGEGERSALYVFPFLVVPAAHALDRMGQTVQSRAPLLATAAFLAVQCWLIESYFYTYW